MCGIAGIFNYADPACPVDRPLLERMTQALSHRGPDGEGLWIQGPIGLRHRRLAIVDLTPTGAQPMRSADGGCITYNGELYNHLDLRGRLLAGHPFRGRSDTETLLGLLERRGPDVLPDLVGIFAFAYWDSRARRLLLARDPLGVKQLYFNDDGRRLLFASEMKALVQCAQVSRELDGEALNQYLHFHTPIAERTFFRGIRQLRPGERVLVDRSGRQHATYWTVTEFGGGPPDGDAVDELRAVLATVVSDQLMSDVPVGAFFSGGIDSSAVAAFASRAGKAPRCFGVHFADQGVVDERPFQESAARALGLDLELTTYDGARFADDLPRLLFQQDQPVIGPAMFPMSAVSELAARSVKVCLGGQGADEIFGGYARYALVHPLKVAGGMVERARSRAGGNLLRDLRELRTWRRLARLLRTASDWQETYFSHVAAVPERSWRELIDGEVVSRESCRALFRETLSASDATDPADKVMHWDALTYLPGLFQQDDRMSMAHGLESRVPLADPRLVRFAFRYRFDQKFRNGSSKWVLREAVSDVLPPDVLNRRKVGFDTPAETWMRRTHRGFVREVLLSSRARARGLWNAKNVERLLDANDSPPFWFARVWKLLCTEIWATVFQDAGIRAPVAVLPDIGRRQPPGDLRALVQEVKELGVGRAAFRAKWELENAVGLPLARDLFHRSASPVEPVPFRLPPPAEIRSAVLPLLPSTDLAHVESAALQAGRGRVVGFGHLLLDYGDPVDWHRDPISGRRWDPCAHWSRSLRLRGGDVKVSWEIARFPHFWTMLRAAVLVPERRLMLGRAMASQIDGFLRANPFPRGIHWASGQEIAYRIVAWSLAWSMLRDEQPMQEIAGALAAGIAEGATHIERNFDYVERIVYNNHLISEAVGLLFAALFLPSHRRAPGWRRRALRTLTEQARRQFYPDGAYLQASHNYQRTAADAYVAAIAALRWAGEEVPEAWIAAVDRSVTFLHAHQNPGEGDLPNSGANDGSMFLVLSSCLFSDFRPSLQAASVAARGERLYAQGKWDEPAIWLFGDSALQGSRARRTRASVSFESGYHLLRAENEDTFATFRCGPVRERFGQLDMLHVDLYWHGHPIAVDGGSYCYADEKMHHHLHGTASHNTVTVDGRDQMVQQRRFSSVYLTPARLLRYEARNGRRVAIGEHLGFERYDGAVVHRRAVLLAKTGLCVVIDQLRGTGQHDVRVHWLCAPYPFDAEPSRGRLLLQTPEGPFSVSVLDGHGAPVPGDVCGGCGHPPRGWFSRRYLEKQAAPSLAVSARTVMPATFVSVLAPGVPSVSVIGRRWSVANVGDTELIFDLGIEGIVVP